MSKKKKMSNHNPQQFHLKITVQPPLSYKLEGGVGAGHPVAQKAIE